MSSSGGGCSGGGSNIPQKHRKMQVLLVLACAARRDQRGLLPEIYYWTPSYPSLIRVDLDICHCVFASFVKWHGSCKLKCKFHVYTIHQHQLITYYAVQYSIRVRSYLILYLPHCLFSTASQQGFMLCDVKADCRSTQELRALGGRTLRGTGTGTGTCMHAAKKHFFRIDIQKLCAMCIQLVSTRVTFTRLDRSVGAVHFAGSQTCSLIHHLAPTDRHAHGCHVCDFCPQCCCC